MGWAREFPPGARLKLRVHLEQWPAGDPKELIRQAIHNDFAHRSQLNTLEFRAMRQADELVRPCLRYKCRVLAQPAESL